jgi:hypothetical protein
MLPLDIAIQSILSLLLAMFGVLHIAGEFKVFLFKYFFTWQLEPF